MLFFLACLAATVLIAFGLKDAIKDRADIILPAVTMLVLSGFGVVLVLLMGAVFIEQDKYVISTDTQTVALQEITGSNGEKIYLQAHTEDNTTMYQFLGTKPGSGNTASELDTIKASRAEVIADGSEPRLVSVSENYKVWWFAPFTISGLRSTHTFYLSTSDQLLTNATTK
jgi:hypothetical protein